MCIRDRYNEGCQSKMRVLNYLDIAPGEHTKDALKKFNMRRLRDAENRFSKASLEERRVTRRLRLERELTTADKEEGMYAAGEFKAINTVIFL